MPVIYNNIRDAITIAFSWKTPKVIAYYRTPEETGWIIYDPSFPVNNSEPDLLCIKLGTLPVPLSDTGRLILSSLIRNSLDIM